MPHEPLIMGVSRLEAHTELTCIEAGISSRPRRRLRFTVAQMMITVAVFALLSRLLIQPLVRFRKERHVLEMLNTFGGHAGRGTDGVTYSQIGKTSQAVGWPEGLTSPLTQLHLDDTNLTDKELQELGELTELVGLWLDGTNITDDGLASIRDLRKLHRLYLSNTNITDRGLRHLTRMKNLAELRIQNTKVTDAGVAELQANLPRCQIVR